jgi:hypothetical protein
MKFGYILNDIGVVIDVFHFKPYCPMRVTGTGFGDCEPEELEEFEFSVLDQHGLVWPEMAEKIDQAEEARILAFYKKLRGFRQ